MSKMKNMIVAAAALAMTAPLVGAAEAKPNGLHGAKQALETPGAAVHLARSDRYERRRGSVRTPVINRRIATLSSRINRGRARGSLTRLEAFRLKNRLFRIRAASRFAKLDGRVTRSERHRLNSMLDVNSSKIRRFSRNDRRS